MRNSASWMKRHAIAGFILASIWFFAPPAIAQEDDHRDEAHLLIHGDMDKIDRQIEGLIEKERFLEAAQRAEQFLANERKLHTTAHKHLIEVSIAISRLYLEAGEVGNADRIHVEAIGIGRKLAVEEPERLEAEQAKICNRLGRIIGKRELFIEPNQFRGCDFAFTTEMMQRFVQRVADHVSRGDKRGARELVEARATIIDNMEDAGFDASLEASQQWVGALGLTGTKAFELDMGQVADRMYRRARQFAEAHLPEDDPYAATSKATLANRLDIGGEHYAAEILHAEAWETITSTGGERSALAMTWAANYGLNQLYLGKNDEAASLLETSLDQAARRLGKTHPLFLSTLSNYVIALNRAGRTEEAEAIIAGAVAQLDHLQDASREEFDDGVGADKQEQFFLIFLSNIATSEFDRKSVDNDREIDRVLALQERVYSRTRRLLGEENEQSILAALNLARGYAYSGTNAARAQALAREAFETWSGNDLQRSLVEIEKSAQQTSQIVERLTNLTVLDAYGIAQSTQEPQAIQDIVFSAMQEEGNTDASAAIAREFARSAASREDSALLELVERREQLLDRWIENERKIRESYADAERGQELNRKVLQRDNAAISVEFPKIESQIAKDFPAYFAITRAEPLTKRSARRLMADDEATLIAIPSIEGLHTALVTRNSVTWSKSSLGLLELGEAVRRLQWFLGSDVEFLPEDDLSFMDMIDEEGLLAYDFETANLIYRELIAPFADQLEGKSHLFVASSGPLTSLPLGVLVSEIPDKNADPISRLRSAKWLSDEYAIVQIPSLQALAFQRSYRQQEIGGGSKTQLVGFGDPVLEGKAAKRGLTKRSTLRSAGENPTTTAHAVWTGAVDVAGKPIIDQARLRALARLPGTSLELRAMQEVLSAPDEAIRLGENATETEFRETDLADTSILVLATHGLVAGEISGLTEPGLVFTPPAEPTAMDDGFLASSEIAAMRIGADWVILSACNTASSSGELGAPGLSGLAKAFFFAGARNLLASHWPVRDDVAPELTVRTMELAASDSGFSRAQAFQVAMREIRENTSADSANDSWAHPNAWAAFTLIGDR
jgi:CHAT domain-containing protein